MSWTPDRIDTLTRLWADGLSAAQISRHLGGVSRNAVIGKAGRLGLLRRPRKSYHKNARHDYRASVFDAPIEYARQG